MENKNIHSDQIKNAFRKKENALIFETFSADTDTPVSLFLKYFECKDDSFLLESVTGGEIKGRYSIIGTKPDLIWKCVGDKAFISRDHSDFIEDERDVIDSLRNILDESSMNFPESLPPMSSGLFGYLGYEMIGLAEKIPQSNVDRLNVPDSIFIRPSVITIVDGVKDEVTVVCPVWYNKFSHHEKAFRDSKTLLNEVTDALSKPLSIVKRAAKTNEDTGKLESNTTKDEYLTLVETAKESIKAGEIFQIVLSQRWEQDFFLPHMSLYRALRRTNPSPYMFFFKFKDFSIVGASPEILVKVVDNEVTIRPIAGTRPRGKSLEEDQALATDLLNDEKENAEHLMLLDLGRNDVGKVSKVGSVRPTETFIIEKYSHVMHIVSNVVGKLKEGEDCISALFAGLPAGTVSGAPKIRAMELIDELEKEKRGVYGGGVGFFSSDGSMDICIALRTGVIKDKKLFIQAGGGVVYDSDPEEEYEETVNKSKALVVAAQEAYKYNHNQ